MDENWVFSFTKAKAFLRLCTIITALLLTACIEGTELDISGSSTIYFTNNTAQPLSLEVSHYGDSSLREGWGWKQEAHHIAPYATAEILTFTRNLGLEKGQQYRFETLIHQQGNEVLRLVQNVSGDIIGSDMQFGLSSPNIAETLSTHSQVQRILHEEGRLEFSYKASNKTFFKDVHYALTEKQVNALANRADNGSRLSLLSYNIAALPHIAENIAERLQQMPRFLQGYDVLLLQEAFSAEREALFLALESEYPYRTAVLNKAGYNVHDGGVVIFSRYPIVNEKQYIFPECTLADCLADKGVNYAEIIKDGQAFHVFATHLASFNGLIVRHLRQQQIQQMASFADSLDINPAEVVIFGGDMNVNKNIYQHDYKQMLSHLTVAEPEYQGYSASTFDPRINSMAEVLNNKNPQYLDYIFSSNKHAPITKTINHVSVPRTSQLWGLWDLSDHFPVAAQVTLPAATGL